MKKLHKGFLFLALSILAYSTMPILIRVLDTGNLPPATQVFFRYTIACIVSLIYVLYKKEKISFKQGNIFLLFIIGIFGYALTNLFYTYSMLKTEINNALFIFFSFGIIAPIMSFLWLKEKVNKYNILSLIGILIALFFLFKPNSFDTWKIGAVFAFLSALSQAFYIVGRKKLKAYSSSLILLASTLLGVITVGFISFINEASFYSDDIFNISSETWLLTVLFGVLNFFGWFFMSKGFESVKATTGSIAMLGELVLTMIFSMIVFQEIPTIYSLIGGVLIIICSILAIVKGKN